MIPGEKQYLISIGYIYFVIIYLGNYRACVGVGPAERGYLHLRRLSRKPGRGTQGREGAPQCPCHPAARRWDWRRRPGRNRLGRLKGRTPPQPVHASQWRLLPSRGTEAHFVLLLKTSPSHRGREWLQPTMM